MSIRAALARLRATLRDFLRSHASTTAGRPEPESGEHVTAPHAPPQPGAATAEAGSAAAPATQIESDAGMQAAVSTPTVVDRVPDDAADPPPVPQADGHDAAALQPMPDPEAEALLTKAAQLEACMLDLSARLAHMENQRHRFEHRQYVALGGVLAECLRLRHVFLQLKAQRSGEPDDADEARKADAEFEAYRRTSEVAAEPLPVLDEAEQDELRAQYRVAVMRHHPDRAAEADRGVAHDVFLQVQAAYRALDIDTMRRIVDALAADHEPDADAARSDVGAGLRRRVGELQIQVADLILAIQTLQLSQTYRQSLHSDRWEEDFARARAGFEAECMMLRSEIRALGGEPG